MTSKFCRCDSAVLSGVTLMLFSCIVWLKLVSYAHTNYDLRAIAKSLDEVITRVLYLICYNYIVIMFPSLPILHVVYRG